MSMVDTTLALSQDSVWLRRVRAGDEEAARALVQRLYPTVIKSVRCHRPQHCTEEDLAQAVFSKVFSKLDQFSGTVPLEHWVSRITVNTCLSQLSREKLRPELRMSDLGEDEHMVVEHLLSTGNDIPAQQSVDARELLDKLLAMLKPEERLIVKLLHLEERSTEEISRATGWSISRVKVKAFRARNKMRKAWDRLRAMEYSAQTSARAKLDLALSKRSGMAAVQTGVGVINEDGRVNNRVSMVTKFARTTAGKRRNPTASGTWVFPAMAG